MATCVGLIFLDKNKYQNEGRFVESDESYPILKGIDESPDEFQSRKLVSRRKSKKIIRKVSLKFTHNTN